MSIAKQIKKYRLNSNMSQRELGEKLGISQQQIAQYENGKRIPKLKTLGKIAMALEVPLYELTEMDYSQYSEQEIKDNFLSFATPYKYFHDSVVKKAIHNEQLLLDDYRKLNSDGQKEALKRVNELTEIKKYTEIEVPYDED